MKRVLFIDRDGTIIHEPQDEQIDSLEKLSFLPGSISGLAKIAKLDFTLVMVTNQDGLGTDSFPEETFWPAHNIILKTLQSEGIVFKDILIDKSFPNENKPTRKPGTGLLKKYINGKYDLAESYVIGDRESDIQLAKNLGAKAIFISDKYHPDAILSTTNWNDIYRFLALETRTVKINRKTQETDISLELNLDGSGKADIKTGIGFLDHMLHLFARHSGVDLSIKIKGDLQVDEHHTTEDCAIVLGQALEKALGNKKGLERYGFVLPMDESYAIVALDFSGRSDLIWKVKFKREKLGEMPTEMFHHFFKSFSDNARCNLLIKAKGKNEHHKIEAIFKGVARCVRQAVRREPGNQQVPSSKELL
ncbi:MAG: bifunctional histidinol-phosphatase/imidazoleglycerol-phosphate dehydratase HisB [Calditrichaeota bacterium]|nr:bifunctional histidinol-phosphatase/imidazoleglycerol-phosphate dehydratase HisB [Calditrichota bacterium]